MKRFWMDFTVGLFVVTGFASLAFLSFRVGNLGAMGAGGDSQYTVVAMFDNVGSVRVGSPVKSAGIAIGKVTTIDLDPANFRARVKVAINKSYSFPADSSVSVMTAGLLGEQYLSVSPGIESDPLKDGDEIAYTESAMVLEKLIGQLMLAFTKKDDQATKSQETATTPNGASSIK